jgi:hypothetical protein
VCVDLVVGLVVLAGGRAILVPGCDPRVKVEVGMSDQVFAYNGQGVEVGGGGWDEGVPGNGEAGGWEGGYGPYQDPREMQAAQEAQEAARAEADAAALIQAHPQLDDPQIAKAVVEHASEIAAQLGLPPQAALAPGFLSSVTQTYFSPESPERAAARGIAEVSVRGAGTAQERKMWGA